MRIPEIRTRLYELADELDLPELEALADHLWRRRPVTQAPAASARIGADERARILAYHAAHPAATQAEIARAFGCNPGRVSEALAGKRT